MKPALKRSAPWLAALGLAALAAFAVGRCTAPDGNAEHTHAETETTWTCAMHPQVRQPEPGLCPICGMDLIPLRAGDAPGPGEVTLSPRAAALARVRTTPVRRLGGGGALRLLGRVALDETTLDTVTAWVGGRIERLHVRVTGQRIRRGQAVATLYSPEIYAAQQDLITARRQLERLEGASELARSGARATLEAARQRLRLLGVPDAELTRLEAAESPARRITIRSPFGGTVIERLTTEGAYVQTGTPLYRLADLDRLWVQLDAYEQDLARLEVGQSVRLEVQGLSGEPLDGRVAFLDPVVDPRTRTARVRVEVANPDGRLRPGMFVEATLDASAEAGATEPLVVPASAPLFTGRRALVYVEVEGGPAPTYVARPVRLGPRAGDHYPVVAGLAEGERVVTEGAFALDADLQIRGGDSLMTAPEADPFADVHADLPAAFRAGLGPVVERYLDVQRALADDDLEAARRSAGAADDAAAAFTPDAPEAAAARWAELSGRIRAEAARIRSAASLEAARGAFEPLSAAIADVLRAFGNPLDAPLRLTHCPMAFDDRGAAWVQAGEAVDNAYFGASMLTCGSVRETVPPGGFLSAEGAR